MISANLFCKCQEAWPGFLCQRSQTAALTIISAPLLSSVSISCDVDIVTNLLPLSSRRHNHRANGIVTASSHGGPDWGFVPLII